MYSLVRTRAPRMRVVAVYLCWLQYLLDSGLGGSRARCPRNVQLRIGAHLRIRAGLSVWNRYVIRSTVRAGTYC